MFLAKPIPIIQLTAGSLILQGWHSLQRKPPYKVTLINRSSATGRHMLNADHMVYKINQLQGLQARYVIFADP